MKKNANITQTFLQYKSVLARHIRGIISQPQDIEDIVQETFVKAYEAELKHDIDYPKTYMLRTVKNLALNHVQKWDNRYSDSMEDFSESAVKLIGGDLEKEFESKQRFLLFCRAVEQLPSQCRKAFVLKKVYGLSQKEIAAYLNISESTVEKHIAKGVLNSFKYMKEHESATPGEKETTQVSGINKAK